MISFLLPESRDLVDLNYDFGTDSYHHRRSNGFDHDVYAHEIYGTPNCDGLLVTKSNVTQDIEEQILQAGGIHRYFRFPQESPVMGDCGAFQFIGEEKPPYNCRQICDYYENLSFDLGVTLDHVIVQFDIRYDQGHSLFPLEPTDAMKYRFRLTLTNAKRMLNMVRRHGMRFRPVGSVQGWSPKSYHQGIKELIDAGFDYIALGGIARAPNEVIVSILREIRQTVANAGVKLHVLGVARLNILDEYLKTGVTSCDSASTIMQAFKSGKDNYHTPEKNYTAVRIPPVYGDMSPKVRAVLKPYKETGNLEGLEARQAELGRLEQEALRAVRGYAKRRVSLKAAMATLTAYEDEFGDERKYYPYFEETLRDRPWEKCPCVICQQLGVEVVILRGNNRNRRRGFHNTYVFYQQFKAKVGRR